MNTKALNIATVGLVTAASAQDNHHAFGTNAGNMAHAGTVSSFTTTSTNSFGNEGMDLSAAEMLELNALKNAQVNGNNALADQFSNVDMNSNVTYQSMRLSEAQELALKLATEATEVERVRITNSAKSAEDIARIEASSISVMASNEAMRIQREEEAKALL